MAEKSSQLVLTALSRAAADPGGLPLYAGKAQPGLFAGTTAGKQVAQRCKDEGYLRVVRTETRGKVTHEICTLTDKGLAYLLSQVSPRHVLEDLLRALEARHGQVGELVATARHMQTNLEGLRTRAEQVLQRLEQPRLPVAGAGERNGHPEPAPAAPTLEMIQSHILACVQRWHAAGSLDDYPLPELYRQVCQAVPGLTLGQFHDALRGLHDRQKIHLHPWTAPLCDLPEPPCALLIGHEILYYANSR